jgi:hypothetical protein
MKKEMQLYSTFSFLIPHFKFFISNAPAQASSVIFEFPLLTPS